MDKLVIFMHGVAHSVKHEVLGIFNKIPEMHLVFSLTSESQSKLSKVQRDQSLQIEKNYPAMRFFSSSKYGNNPLNSFMNDFYCFLWLRQKIFETKLKNVNTLILRVIYLPVMLVVKNVK